MTQLTLAQVADSIPRYQELLASGADMRALDETLTVNTFFRPIPRFSRYLVSGEPERICIYDTKRGRYSAQQLNPHDKYWQVGLLGDDGKWKRARFKACGVRHGIPMRPRTQFATIWIPTALAMVCETLR